MNFIIEIQKFNLRIYLVKWIMQLIINFFRFLEGRTFGHHLLKRLSFAIIPAAFVIGVITTLLAALTIVSIKGLGVGVSIYSGKLSNAYRVTKIKLLISFRSFFWSLLLVKLLPVPLRQPRSTLTLRQFHSCIHAAMSKQHQFGSKRNGADKSKTKLRLCRI